MQHTMRQHTVRIFIGDSSHDGHGITQDFLLRVNYTKEAIEEAYAESVRRTGFDYIDEICEAYQNIALTEKQIAKLQSIGVKVDIDEWDMEACEQYVVSLFSFIALSLSDLTFEFVEDKTPVLFGMKNLGYGLLGG